MFVKNFYLNYIFKNVLNIIYRISFNIDIEYNINLFNKLI